MEPAKDATEFKKFMGRYLTEGIQGIDYFIHFGNLIWDEGIRAQFEQMQPMIQMLGRYKLPEAKIAMLYSNRVEQLLGYPWDDQPNVTLTGGYWQFNLAASFRGEYAYDGLTRTDFPRGNAQRYPIILDSNTSLMDDELLGSIRDYVKGGGVFVTYAQTGRSTSTRYDSWPISELTGYDVVKVDALTDDGEPEETRRLRAAPNQKIFQPDDVPSDPANGLTLKRKADDVTDLLLWEDGSVAAGMRRIGKGWIIQLGAKFRGAKLDDRYPAGGTYHDKTARMKLLRALFRAVFKIFRHL